MSIHYPVTDFAHALSEFSTLRVLVSPELWQAVSKRDETRSSRSSTVAVVMNFVIGLLMFSGGSIHSALVVETGRNRVRIFLVLAIILLEGERFSLNTEPWVEMTLRAKTHALYSPNAIAPALRLYTPVIHPVSSARP